MKINSLSSLLRNGLMALLGLSVALLPQVSSAQSADDAVTSLDEITVTARKREETLQEVPVSISVFGDELIHEAGIQTQRDLFDLTPGIQYDEQIDRNSASPSVRGVQASEIATNRTKVSQFVDGMPVLGSQGNIQFENIQQIEVYRGPQSAAFGRSTFGGAINYVTKDPGEEFEGSVNVDFDDYGKQRISGSVGGPISEKVGFLLSANWEDSDSPSEFKATDGTQYGARSSESYSGKLVFNPTDAMELELSFGHVESHDAPSVAYFLSQEARDACFDGTLISNMGTGVYRDGTYNCDWKQGHEIAVQNDRRAVLAASGLPVNDDMLFIAEMQSIPKSHVGPQDERDRFSLQLDQSFDNGSLLQFSAFTGDENYIRHNDNTGSYTIPISITPGVPMGPGPVPQYVFNTMGAGVAVGEIMSDPSEIEETYAEVRWVSPGEDKLRWVVGASYYDYSFITNLYFGGYNAILKGQDAVDRYIALTLDDISVPQQVFQESATNVGVFFNVNYDATDKLTLTAEGRYQTDDVGGVDSVSNLGGSIKTKKFLPRLSFNYAIGENNSFYGQYSKGNNPAGVNVGFFNPAIAGNLDGPGQTYVNYDSDTFKFFEEETLNNYELGFKGSSADRTFTYATAIFMLDWNNSVQTLNLNWGDPNAPPGPPNPLEGNRSAINEGDLTMSGIEFEGTYRFNDNWSLRATASVMDAEYDDYCSVTLLGSMLDTDPDRVILAADSGNYYDCYSVNGLEVEQQSSFTGSLSPSYRGQIGQSGLGLSVRADIRHQGPEYLDTTNTARAPAVTTINLSAGLSSEMWDATLYVNNLTDDDTPLQYNRGTDYYITTNTQPALGPNFQSNYRITPRQQRTIGLRARFRF